MKQVTTIATGIALATLFLGTAHAQTAHHGDKQHAAMQAPASAGERVKMADAMFDRIDTDKNDSISRAEFAAHHRDMKMGGMPMGHGPKAAAKAGNPGFAKLDANKDGKLSKEEMAKHPMAAHFGMMDADKDGFLTQAEFASH